MYKPVQRSVGETFSVTSSEMGAEEAETPGFLHAAFKT